MTTNKKFVYYYDIKISLKDIELLYEKKMNLEDLLTQKILARHQMEYCLTFN